MALKNRSGILNEKALFLFCLGINLSFFKYLKALLQRE
jgi:hypothetical protein